MKRISLSHIHIRGVFGDQPDSGLLAAQDKMISVNFQGLPQVGEVSVASAPSAISLNVFSCRRLTACCRGGNALMLKFRPV